MNYVKTEEQRRRERCLDDFEGLRKRRSELIAILEPLRYGHPDWEAMIRKYNEMGVRIDQLKRAGERPEVDFPYSISYPQKRLLIH
jgi:hypothetical protein